MQGAVYALTVFDDGSGPALFAGGTFSSADGVAANNIAKWDGEKWSPLGAGLGGGIIRVVNALAVFDDGSGSALYAGGSFIDAGGAPANRIAKWDGSSWTPLGAGLDLDVNALAVFDDGTGPALFAGGSFTSAGGSSASRVAKWDGSAWSALGSGVNLPVRALAAFDDGTGVALFVAGDFSIAGGVGASQIAKWNGNAWSPLGSGLKGGVFGVYALAAFDDGTGNALYAGGPFVTAGTVNAVGIARWNGSSWSAVGGGLGTVSALLAFDDGTGPTLFAATSSLVYEWRGSQWVAPTVALSGQAALTQGISALAVFDAGAGPALHAGGTFTKCGNAHAGGIAVRTDQTWFALGNGLGGSNSTLRAAALGVFDDGAGAALYVGGEFASAGYEKASNIARWDGTSWSALGSGVSGGAPPNVRAFASFDDGTGPALYAGGSFIAAGGVGANNIAMWDGAHWAHLGSGAWGGVGANVAALVVFDDGSGPALYAGGSFTNAGVVSAANIAKWSGSSWASLGSGIVGSVASLVVFDDGGGPALYVAGTFTAAGGVAARNVAKWNGSSWAPLGGGISFPVVSLVVFDDGSGPALYAGEFSFVSKWNGTTWSPLPSLSGSIVGLTVFDDGTGPALYATEAFNGHLAKWNGVQWTELGTGLDDAVYALAVFDDGTGSGLYAGGDFAAAGGRSTNKLARWGCLLPAGVRRFGAASSGCSGPPTIDVTSSPQLGNGAFAITCAQAPPNAAGALLAGAALGQPVPFLGTTIWVSPLLAPGLASDPLGQANFALPIPAESALAGAHVDVQFVWIGPHAPLPCPQYGVSASRGLGLTVQR